MRTAYAWWKIVVLALGLAMGGAASAAEYLSGIWAIPASGQLGERLHNVPRAACETRCSDSQTCTGFFAFTDAAICQLYGPGADVADRVGPWPNVQMNWKKASPDPLVAYTSTFAAVPDHGAITDLLRGYQPQQCAKMCDAKKDCISFHAFTDWDVCRLYGLDATWSSKNGPWSNVKMHVKTTQPRILMVDVNVLTKTGGGNEGWTKDYLQKLLGHATGLMNNGEVVYSLGQYNRVVDDALYDRRSQSDILVKYSPAAKSGRVTVFVSGPSPADTMGQAWVGPTLAPLAVIATPGFEDVHLPGTAAIFLHEMGHTMGFHHNEPTGQGNPYRFPYPTDWYWNTSPLARQVFVRLADWTKLHQSGIDARSKDNYQCAAGAKLPDRGAFPLPHVPAPTSQECAARCNQAGNCVAFYTFTDNPTCVLFDATSIGRDTQQGWMNVEMCRRK